MRAASGRQSQDAQFHHMTSTDTGNPLAYLDYSQLGDLIEGNWPVFEPALIRRSSWTARQDELARIRHRIGHMRRPHEDDLNRIEQTLRDLERGAFIACASYNKRVNPSPGDNTDAVTAGWVCGQHQAATLIDHARHRYGTNVVITASKRPWAQWSGNLSNAAGILWHVGFAMTSRSADVSDFWHAASFATARSLAVHLVAEDPSNLSLTFAAADNDLAVADAIASTIETVLSISRPGYLDEDQQPQWQRRALQADYRVIHATGWDTIDETTIPVSVFGAGGGSPASAISW